MQKSKQEKCLRVTKKERMGRLRTTGCASRHWPGEPCKLCARLRARRTRAKTKARRKRNDGPTVTRTPERIELDRAAAEHRAVAARARAYITKYLKRGAILPPEACEHCGVGQQLTRYSKVVQLHAWHPDPTRLHDVAWLCTDCRNYARAAGEPVELRWQWPGKPSARRGRPRRLKVDSEWIAAAEAASQRTRTPGLSEELFFTFFSKAAGRNSDALYLQSVRAAAKGVLWSPTGNATTDSRLRAWSAFIRSCNMASSTSRLIEPMPHWERRQRIDRMTLLPLAIPGPEPRAPFDQAAYDRRIIAALDKLAMAEAHADALLARYNGSRAVLTIQMCAYAPIYV